MVSNVCWYLRPGHSSVRAHREQLSCQPCSTVPLVMAPVAGREGASLGGSTRLHSPDSIHMKMEAPSTSVHKPCFPFTSLPLPRRLAVKLLQIYIRAGGLRIWTEALKATLFPFLLKPDIKPQPDLPWASCVRTWVIRTVSVPSSWILPVCSF